MSTPIPNYAGACISNVVPAISLSLAQNRSGPDWLSYEEVVERIQTSGCVMDLSDTNWIPKVISEATQVVLFVVDGLGSLQLEQYLTYLPNLSKLVGTTVTSVAPTTTATALMSIASALTPIDHGVVGYRMRLGKQQVFNSLQWRCRDNATNRRATPSKVARNNPFLGLDVSVISKFSYAGTGFTRAYLGEAPAKDFRFLSTMVAKVKDSLASGAPFVYCYYEGVDSVAHEYGLSNYYFEELRFLDFLIGELLNTLPYGASLVLTADHGQVEVLDAPIVLNDELEEITLLKSGEGRFRWLHVDKKNVEKALDIAHEQYDDIAWVVERDEALESGLFGPNWNSRGQNAARFGNLALIAKADVAFFDAHDSGPMELVCRHGSLTDNELIVPLVGCLKN